LTVIPPEIGSHSFVKRGREVGGQIDILSIVLSNARYQ